LAEFSAAQQVRQNRAMSARPRSQPKRGAIAGQWGGGQTNGRGERPTLKV